MCEGVDTMSLEELDKEFKKKNKEMYDEMMDELEYGDDEE